MTLIIFYLVRTMFIVNILGFIFVNILYLNRVISGERSFLDMLKKHVLSYFFVLLILSSRGRNILLP